MRILLLIPLVYVAAVLDTSLAGVIRVGQIAPDLLATLAVVWLLIFPGPRSFLAAGAVGLAGDLVSPGRVGVAAICFLLVGYAIARLRSRFALDHVVWQVAVVWVGVTLLAAGMAVGRWLLGEISQPVAGLLLRSLGVGVYSAGVSLPLLMVIGWIREPFRKTLTA
jgi:rod shape-determining protein MreD